MNRNEYKNEQTSEKCKSSKKKDDYVVNNDNIIENLCRTDIPNTSVEAIKGSENKNWIRAIDKYFECWKSDDSFEVRLVVVGLQKTVD